MTEEIRAVLAAIIGITIIYFSVQVNQKLRNKKLATAKIFLKKERIYHGLLALLAGTAVFFAFGFLWTAGMSPSKIGWIMWIYWLSFLYLSYQLNKVLELGK